MLDNFVYLVPFPFPPCQVEKAFISMSMFAVSFPCYRHDVFCFCFAFILVQIRYRRVWYVESTNDISDGLEGNIGISGRDFVELYVRRIEDAIVFHVCALTFSNSKLFVWNFSNWI